MNDSQNKTATLLRDIVSIVKPPRVYGRRNDKVKVISVVGGVAIVEGKSGRFAVKEEEIQVLSK